MSLFKFSDNVTNCDFNCMEHLGHVIMGMKHLIKINEERGTFTTYHTAKIEVAISVLEGLYSSIWGEDVLKELLEEI
ncbi:hypothetical protein HS141_12890 [Cetobacterium somerae]|uniref:hypothetical protein n=1 Tax=Cetobacterium somerae TaxID=188913 RepID=UPI00211E30F9|nr:hypothetical protein [Cetobacterium somerae]MCQ9627820.1 hypothetical protein [Cetobacterium somerae]